MKTQWRRRALLVSGANRKPGPKGDAVAIFAIRRQNHPFLPNFWRQCGDNSLRGELCLQQKSSPWAANSLIFIGKLERAKGFEPSTRSEEHTSELQSLMRTSYAVFCLKKKTNSYVRRPLHTPRH